MPKYLTLELTEEQRKELTWHRDHDPKPHMRARCAALLMIADGSSPANVAHHRLYRRREPDTVYRWQSRYLREGIAGLGTQPGRERKPAFSPSLSGARLGERCTLTCGEM